MVRLIIIADDLTGALDTAAPFAAVPGGVDVATCPEALPAALAGGAGVVAVSTRSREVAPEQAHRVVADALKRLPEGALLFKKIDSRLKGNVEAELQALPGKLVVLPAIPEFGRVVQGGALRGFGVDVPLPVAPRLGAAAARATIPDVTTGAEMAAALAAADGATLVGARGLAQALAARWGLGGVSGGALPVPACFVVGSIDPITRAQVAHLLEAAPAIHCVDAVAGVVPPLAGPLPPLTLVRTDETRQDTPQRVAAAFATGVRSWLDQARGILLTGGATAEAVLDALDITLLRLEGEALPGLPVCRAGDRVLVTKSGGFGQPDALARLVPQDETAEA